MVERTLSAYTRNGRDNNFNLLRFIAAFLVLLSHSFALAIGTSEAEPLRASIGMTPGTIAVDIFFITSGFLVTRSLLTRRKISDFIVSRALRIYPGLIVSVVLTLFLCGLVFHLHDLGSYLSDDKTLTFLTQNCISLFSTAFTLPGVFTDNPFPNAVNGSLWTLPLELRMYASLIIIWLIVLYFSKFQPDSLKVCFTTIPIILLILYYKDCGFKFQENCLLRLVFLFYCGALYYIWREKIPINWLIFSIALSLLLAAAFSGSALFFPIYMLSLPYLILFLAYVPAGFIRRYNSYGDYSYGIYIYAFPVQQMIAFWLKPVSVLRVFLLSALISFVFAFLSWHLVEKRFLSLKKSGPLSFALPKWKNIPES
uniref:Putative acyltransferase n=1 Tax=Desulfovibrio sp. U5L TaxID=596152 RepID=I2Q3D5_9BACT